MTRKGASLLGDKYLFWNPETYWPYLIQLAWDSSCPSTYSQQFLPLVICVSEKQVKALGCQSWDHVTPFSPMVSFMDSNTHYNQPHKMLLSHCVYVCFLCLCSALLTLTFRFEAGLLCLCKDHSAHRTSHNAPPPVLACHRSTEGMWGVRGGRKGSISYQPRVSTVGCLFILCNLALIGAKMQTQWQIRCLIPYSKPSLGDA